MATRGPSSAYRWSVASRAIAATAGGYALTWLCTTAIARLLHHACGLARVDAVLVATMLGILLYAAAAIAIFAARSARRAWMGLGLACLPPIIILTAIACWTMLRTAMSPS